MCQNSCWNVEFIVFFIFCVDVWGGQQQFVWVDKILVVCVVFKIMLVCVGFEVEEVVFLGDCFGWVILLWVFCYCWWNKGLDYFVVSDDCFVCFDVQCYIFGLQVVVVFIFMNFGVDVQCGKQWIEWVGGGMQYKGVIQLFVWIEMCLVVQMVIFFMDL